MLEERASIVSILSCGQKSGERCTKEGLVLYTMVIEVKSVEFEEDTCTAVDFEKKVFCHQT